MNRPKPLFLAQGPYRSRRLADAARLLPILGTFLFFLPILWQPDRSPGADTAGDGLYLFGIWAALIVVAAILARRLPAQSVQTDAQDDG